MMDVQTAAVLVLVIASAAFLVRSAYRKAAGAAGRRRKCGSDCDCGS